MTGLDHIVGVVKHELRPGRRITFTGLLFGRGIDGYRDPLHAKWRPLDRVAVAIPEFPFRYIITVDVRTDQFDIYQLKRDIDEVDRFRLRTWLRPDISAFERSHWEPIQFDFGQIFSRHSEPIKQPQGYIEWAAKMIEKYEPK